jgi:hypothetical protein
MRQDSDDLPGSRLRVRFTVRPPPRIGLAFRGSPVERSTATRHHSGSLIRTETGHFCTVLCQEGLNLH